MGSDVKKRSSPQGPGPRASDVDRLRALILGDQYEQTLHDIQSADEAQRVARVVAEAIHVRGQQDNSVQLALAPTIDAVLDASIKRNPRRLAQVMAPIIGPSIREAVRNALAEMMESLNRMLERSVSPQFWLWRLQAWHAGIPFAEFLLAKTLQYRVEQVLLIHRDTGIPLLTESREDIAIRDPELVSAMLTAINGFVSDSFRSDTDSADIHRVRFGDRLLLIEVGAQAILAAVVQGDPPARLSARLQTTLEQFHRIFSRRLADFTGDRSAFTTAAHLLQECMAEQARSATTRSGPWLAMVALALAVTLVAVLGWRHWQIGRQQDALIKQLQASAEYVVLDARRDGNKLHLQLLSRFGAPPPQQMLDLSAARNIELSIHTTPVSMNPEDALLPYLEQRYGLGPQVSLQLQGDSLLLAGEMTLQQLQQIRSDRRVNQLVGQLDERAVTLLPAPDQRAVDEARFRALVDQLQRTRFMFAENSADLAETEIAKAATALAQLRTLIELGQNLGISGLQIVITGFADTTGPDALNSRLSRDRALRLSGFFADNRIDEALLVSLGVGSLNAGNLPSLHKRVVAMQILYAPAAPFVAAGESGT